MKRLLEQSVVDGRVSEELAITVANQIRGFLDKRQHLFQGDEGDEFSCRMMHHFCENFQYFAQQPAPASLWGKRISARWRNYLRDQEIRDRLFQKYGERELRRGGLHRVW